MTGLRVGQSVRWRHWQDGIAVFVASTCETHVLSSELLPLFINTPATLNLAHPEDLGGSIKSESNKLFSLQTLNLLAALKIIDIVD